VRVRESFMLGISNCFPCRFEKLKKGKRKGRKVKQDERKCSSHFYPTLHILSDSHLPSPESFIH
jgi:hypothetical protein